MAALCIPASTTRPPASIIVVMQRLHEDDLAGYLMEQEGREILRLPAISEVDELIPIGYGRSLVETVA